LRKTLMTTALLAMASGCAEPTGEITQDAQAFAAVAPSASISMLGTEPFWGLDIEPNGDDDGFTARYSSPEDIEGTSFPVTRFAGNNGLGFSGEFDAAGEGEQAVQIALTPGECSDGMSDRSYPYTATISLGDTTLRGCGYTSDEPFTGDEAP